MKKIIVTVLQDKSVGNAAYGKSHSILRKMHTMSKNLAATYYMFPFVLVGCIWASHLFYYWESLKSHL